MILHLTKDLWNYDKISIKLKKKKKIKFYYNLNIHKDYLDLLIEEN